MPQYEYRCIEDGELMTLLRPMSEADAPVEDPTGRGRAFVRIHSTFSVSGAAPTAPASMPSMGGGCGCGNPHGPCGR